MPDAKKQGRSNKAMTFFVCFLAALAGLLFGLDIGVIAGALPFIADEFQITSHTQEWVVSSMMFGAAVGAVGSGWLSFKLGRKKSLMIGAILFVAGSLFSAAAPNVEVLILSRVLLGLAVGVASYTAPLYLSEIAPEKIRGSMISMYQLMITIGILGAYLSDTAFSYTGAWRWMLGVIIIPAILLLIGVSCQTAHVGLPPNAVLLMPNACCYACVTPARKRNANWMKSVKVCRLNRVAGRCLKRIATSAARCSLAYYCR